MPDKITCPFCGFSGSPGDFTYMQESVLYVADGEVLEEQRERPLLAICPRCRRGFFLEDPYARARELARGRGKTFKTRWD
ncbi:MAG: hypothetical protein ABWK00_05575 [Desulfurococcaceae archaeon]